MGETAGYFCDAEKWASLLGIAEYCWLMWVLEGTKMY